MIARGYKKLLSLVGMATAIAAPLGVLAWQANDSLGNNLSFNNSDNQSQAQSSSTPKTGGFNSFSNPAAGMGLGGASNSKTTITVNGRQIPLSADGHTHTVIQNAGGTTTLDVSITNNVSGNAGSNQSLNNISFYSSSVTSVDGQAVHN